MAFSKEFETKTAVEDVEDTSDSRSLEDEAHWWQQRELRKLYFLMPFLFLGSTTLGYDGSLLNSLQTMPSWQEFFHNPVGSVLGLYGAMPGFGGLVVLLFAPYIADYLGRRNGTAIGNLFVLIGALLQAFPSASNPRPMYLAGRFFIGFGSNISNGTYPLLITEVAHPRQTSRAHNHNLQHIVVSRIHRRCVDHLWHPGPSHREYAMACTNRSPMPHARSSTLSIHLVPESPRFQIARGQPEKARQMLIKYHGNGVDNLFVQWEFEEISNTIRLEREVSSQSGWKEMVRTAGNRKRCILIIATAIFSQCSGNSLVSYYLAQILKSIGITNSHHQALINGGLTIWCWLVALAFAFAVDRIGRRILFLTAAIGMLICFTIWTACAAIYEKTASKAAGNTVLAMIFCFYTVAGLAWPGLTVSYTVEILPYKIRAKGLTLCFCFTALSGVFNQYVNPISLEKLHWKFYFVYIAVLVIECLVIYFYYVETKGLPLEEIARVFDGDEGAAALVADSIVVDERRGSVMVNKERMEERRDSQV